MSPVIDVAAAKLFLRQNDPTSYFALRTLDGLKGRQVESHRADVFRFLIARYGEIPLDRYVRRQRELRDQQSRFEQSNVYSASSCAAVVPADGDDYRVALLLSFVFTNHRFEILDALETFLRDTTDGEPRELLSLGFGTGYELKMVHEILPEWQYLAYDNSADSFEYASDLLCTFACPSTGLRPETFPLEERALPQEHRSRYGKIVLCELLEHLDNPEAALRTMRAALHPQGLMFATMAINIAQEDHVFLYRSKDDARSQVERAGLTVVREFVTPVTVMPFAESAREDVFTKGNYVCVLRRS